MSLKEERVFQYNSISSSSNGIHIILEDKFDSIKATDKIAFFTRSFQDYRKITKSH